MIGKWAAGAALILALCAASQAQAADCAPRLSGDGRLVTFADHLSDPQWLSLTALIHDSLHASSPDARPEKTLALAPACVIDSFRAMDKVWVMSGGAAPAPMRWAKAADGTTFYLVAGVAGADSRALGMRSVPYLLVLDSANGQLIAGLYDGAPSDIALAADIRHDLEDPKFYPMASFDPEGEAVTSFVDSDELHTARLFEPLPDGERAATILLPDGKYFSHREDAAAVMAGSAITCPATAGDLNRERLLVMDVAPKSLMLACDYFGDDGALSVVVRAAPEFDLREAFPGVLASAKEDFVEPKEAPSPIGVGARSHFGYGAAWSSRDGTVGGVWLGRRGPYVIEIYGIWPQAADREVRAAVRALDRGLFAEGS
ncbi:hypothetical protein [Phenylobacterium soli]|uniref:DUF1254 domain-containing protein n=1 Tax=Phenylobacterium soli TaxID=2170551 RepID=A0A328AKL2_9CAUL|nr:hypothetical protein [Phenylobacterium soli]RAK55370.1 hypothetical protein DJ017_13025 [Phenylobacterium soli]